MYCSFLVDISKVQDDVVGDGTTSVVVLAAELLRVIRQCAMWYNSQPSYTNSVLYLYTSIW